MLSTLLRDSMAVVMTLKTSVSLAIGAICSKAPTFRHSSTPTWCGFSIHETIDWDDHFQLVDGVIEGTSPIGVATVNLLNMNDADRVELRRLI
jgi:hypothetical protein